MTDPTPKFDPIPRLQQIAETIKERGAGTFDDPATAAYYINCAINEIERLHRDYSCICNEMRRMMAERDEARRMYCEEAFCHRFDERRFNERCVPSPISNARQIAHNMKWDCFDTTNKETDNVQ